MTTTDEAVCAACEGDGEAHDYDVCGYVNDECPSECSTEHEVEREYVIECPENGDKWRYCCECGWESVSGIWLSDPTDVNGRLYCDPYEHDLSTCSDCGEWFSDYNLHYHEGHDESYCERCYPPRRTADGRPAIPVTTCGKCGTPNTHFDPAEEEFLCTCKAQARRLLVAA